MATQVEEGRKALRICDPQQIELFCDRSMRIQPGVFWYSPPVETRWTVVLGRRRHRANNVERVTHQIKLNCEQLGVDLFAQFVPFEYQVALRPNGAAIDPILRRDQRHHDPVFPLKYLPDVWRPATPFREITGVDDEACSVSLAILGGDHFVARYEKKNVPTRQFSLLAYQFDVVISNSVLDPTLEVWIDRMRRA